MYVIYGMYGMIWYGMVWKGMNGMDVCMHVCINVVKCNVWYVCNDMVYVMYGMYVMILVCI